MHARGPKAHSRDPTVAIPFSTGESIISGLGMTKKSKGGNYKYMIFSDSFKSGWRHPRGQKGSLT